MPAVLERLDAGVPRRRRRRVLDAEPAPVRGRPRDARACPARGRAVRGLVGGRRWVLRPRGGCRGASSSPGSPSSPSSGDGQTSAGCAPRSSSLSPRSPALTAWSFLSLLWAEVTGDAWDGANRTLLYLLVFCCSRRCSGVSRPRRSSWGVRRRRLRSRGRVLLVDRVVSSRAHVDFLGGRLANPTGYQNANAALFMMAFWPAVVAGSRRTAPVALRALALAVATFLAQLAFLCQSRGVVFAAPLVVLAMLVLVPGRLRTIACLALPLVAIVAVRAAVARRLRRGRERASSRGRAPARSLGDAGKRGGRCRRGRVWALVDRRVLVPVRLSSRARRRLRRRGAIVAVAVAVPRLDLADRLDRGWSQFTGRPVDDDGANRDPRTSRTGCRATATTSGRWGCASSATGRSSAKAWTTSPWRTSASVATTRSRLSAQSRGADARRARPRRRGLFALLFVVAILAAAVRPTRPDGHATGDHRGRNASRFSGGSSTGRSTGCGSFPRSRGTRACVRRPGRRASRVSGDDPEPRRGRSPRSARSRHRPRRRLGCGVRAAVARRTARSRGAGHVADRPRCRLPISRECASSSTRSATTPTSSSVRSPRGCTRMREPGRRSLVPSSETPETGTRRWSSASSSRLRADARAPFAISPGHRSSTRSRGCSHCSPSGFGRASGSIRRHSTASSWKRRKAS